jgi:hypothetical protein
MGSRRAKKDLARTCGPKTFQRKVQFGKNCNRNKLCAKTCFYRSLFSNTFFFPMWTSRSEILPYIFANGTVHILPQALELLVCKCPCSKYPSLNFKLRLKFSFFPNIPHFLQQPHYWCLTDIDRLRTKVLSTPHWARKQHFWPETVEKRFSVETPSTR